MTDVTLTQMAGRSSVGSGTGWNELSSVGVAKLSHDCPMTPPQLRQTLHPALELLTV